VLAGHLPHQIHVVDANHLVAVHVDDLLVEQVAFQKKVAIPFHQLRRALAFQQRQPALFIAVQSRQTHHAGRMLAPRPRPAHHQALDVTGVHQRPHRELGDKPHRPSAVIGNGHPHQGRNARPLILLPAHFAPHQLTFDPTQLSSF
jgi:hypothetical protein